MTDYLSLLGNWMDQPHYMLIILIALYFIAAMLDFLLGIANVVYTDKIKFSSKTAQFGIIRKIGIMAVMIVVVPLALMFPMDIAVYSLTILYTGIVVTEIYSVLAHLGIVKDGNKHRNVVGVVFTEFLDRLLTRDKEEKK